MKNFAEAEKCMYSAINIGEKLVQNKSQKEMLARWHGNLGLMLQRQDKLQVCA